MILCAADAYGVALLLIQRLTSFTVVERSRRGLSFDHWLGNVSDSATLPFEKSARLEVAGIDLGIPLRGQFLHGARFAPELH